jgi:hypothetical protein
LSMISGFPPWTLATSRMLYVWFMWAASPPYGFREIQYDGAFGSERLAR